MQVHDISSLIAGDAREPGIVLSEARHVDCDVRGLHHLALNAEPPIAQARAAVVIKRPHVPVLNRMAVKGDVAPLVFLIIDPYRIIRLTDVRSITDRDEAL